MKNNLPLILSLISVIVAFALWYSYAYREYLIQEESIKNEIQYIDISTSTRNITIKNAPSNIRFRVNTEIIHTGSINLK